MITFPCLLFIELHLSSAAVRCGSLFGGPVRVFSQWWCNSRDDGWVSHAICWAYDSWLMRLPVMMMVIVVLVVVICMYHGVGYWKGFSMLWEWWDLCGG